MVKMSEKSHTRKNFTATSVSLGIEVNNMKVDVDKKVRKNCSSSETRE